MNVAGSGFEQSISSLSPIKQEILADPRLRPLSSEPNPDQRRRQLEAWPRSRTFLLCNREQLERFLGAQIRLLWGTVCHSPSFCWTIDLGAVKVKHCEVPPT